MRHDLKTINPYFTQVSKKLKTFEVRKDDRGFCVDDILYLWEYFLPTETEPFGHYTGKGVKARVKYILREFEGLAEGYVVLGITDIQPIFMKKGDVFLDE